MPYEGEFAGYSPLRRLAESEQVKALMSRARPRVPDDEPEAGRGPGITRAGIRPSGWSPDWVLAIDGSHHEVKARNGFPGAEIGCVTIAGVMLDMARIRELDRRRPMDPRQFRSTKTIQSVDRAFPGCNVVIDGLGSARESLRKVLLEVFRETRMVSDGESLLDTYEALLAYKPDDGKGQECPYEDCSADGGKYVRDRGEYSCPCEQSRPLYSTDALRIHEELQPAGSSGKVFGEIMQVLERLLVVHVLRTMEQKQWLSTLQRLAIVLDGPLAVFGHPAWLAAAIRQEISRINARARSIGGTDILLLGIEKGGAFAEHLAQLDQEASGRGGKIPPQVVYLLDDGYIKRNIIFSESPLPYGRNTYFGRKLFYKTASGALVVATVPFLADAHSDTSRADPGQYPRLADALSLLDQMVSSRYPNSLAPLVDAHAEAAIPLHLGARVLEKLAEKLMPRGDA